VGRFVHGDRLTVAYWTIEAGAEMSAHSHPHEQVVNVLGGDFELRVGEVTKRLGEGSVAVIPSGTPHSGTALSATRILDVFSPVREDLVGSGARTG